MTDMRPARLMQGGNGDHSVHETEGSRHALSPSSSDANTWFYPSWKVIVSAYMANTSAGLSRARLFFAPSLRGALATKQSSLVDCSARKTSVHDFVRINPASL